MEKEKSNPPDIKHQKDVKTSKHALRYLIVGIIITIFNYAFYTVLSNIIINNNDFLWLSTLISTAVTTIVAYILHSKITWKERPISKYAKYKFFIWNAILTIAIGPILAQLLSFITPLYDFAFDISQAMHLPFTHEFVLTTGVFIISSAIVMLINFLFYDKFVFGKKKSKGENQ